MQLAQLHIENKNYQVAVKILQQHLRCRPLDAESWQLLATIYAVQGNEDLENFYRERAEDLLSKAQLESAAI
jgi:predicted Zn-dependent protease